MSVLEVTTISSGKKGVDWQKMGVEIKKMGSSTKKRFIETVVLTKRGVKLMQGNSVQLCVFIC
jgi:hypothetical protein